MQQSELIPPGDLQSRSILDDLWNDVRYAVRTMRKNHVFAAFVVLTLGLGIGVNTTVFTLMNTLILNPLPVPEAGELASVVLAESKAAKMRRNSCCLVPTQFRSAQEL